MVEARVCGPSEGETCISAYVYTHTTDVAGREENFLIPLESVPSRPHCVGRFEMPRDRIVDIHVRLCVLPPSSALMQHNDKVNSG